MRRTNTTINPQLSRVISETGHCDLLVVTDAGLPIPPGSERIDLAYRPGAPPFLDVLDTVLAELVIEGATVSAEIEEHSPDLLVALRERLDAQGVQIELIPHGAVTVGYGVNFADGGVAEQDPEDWWNAVVQATRTLMARSGADPADVIGLTVSGQMMGAVLLDANYRPVRPAIIWADTRSTKQTAALEQRIGIEPAYALLGHRLNPTYSLEKVMWVRDEEPDVFARVRHFCVAKDYVVSRLTGRLTT